MSPHEWKRVSELVPGDVLTGIAFEPTMVYDTTDDGLVRLCGSAHLRWAPGKRVSEIQLRPGDRVLVRKDTEQCSANVGGDPVSGCESDAAFAGLCAKHAREAMEQDGGETE